MKKIFSSQDQFWIKKKKSYWAERHKLKAYSQKKGWILRNQVLRWEPGIDKIAWGLGGGLFIKFLSANIALPSLCIYPVYLLKTSLIIIFILLLLANLKVVYWLDKLINILTHSVIYTHTLCYILYTINKWYGLVQILININGHFMQK